MTSLKVTKTTQHKLTTTTTMRSGKKLQMKSGKRLQMNLDSVQIHHGIKQEADHNGNSQNQSSRTILPPPVVETVVSSSQSLTSSIGIGEFGMNPARRGTAATFSVAVKDQLFPKLKFLQGTSACLDFSMDNTSIYQWWEDHCMMLKNIHTDCHNNKIKMMKQQFNGKLM